MARELADVNVAPGSVVVLRDEEWRVTGVERTADGWLLRCQGLSELVRDAAASFYTGLDDVTVLDPAKATVVADGSHYYRQARLWLESTLRKTAVPLGGNAITVSSQMLADSLGYQHAAVRQALDPENLRTRILLADAVGLGKTLEIGMILSELIRRGRGERILIVTPRHVLEQMQHEMWTRFAIPFVRLDSQGIQRVRQKLPASRNPFTYFRRAIISIDTLKSDRYLAYLQRHRWDAVVIDESHNLTNIKTQNSRLARTLAPNTDALILASATPHNGKAESFAELIRLLEPTAVRPDGKVIEAEVRRLIVRRHRHSPEVASVVGADWAERKEPQNWLVPASRPENAVARELDTVWLHPRSGASSYSGASSGASSALFPWTLAKAFLSSPAALAETIRERIGRLGARPGEAQEQEIVALRRLQELNAEAEQAGSAKYDRLLAYLQQIGVGPASPMRAVVFAERVPTLKWLRSRIQPDLLLGQGQVVILHGGLTDDEQRDVIESFKQASSPIRVLVAGDLASEGVNLHTQCHELIHFDIPWSLIRIEQRNGRIDRYGQRHRPQITTLLLNPDTERFSGDLRVLSRLIDKEHEAHAALGDVASLMGKYDVGQEEDEIRKVLAGQADLGSVISEASVIAAEDSIAGLLARIMSTPSTSPGASAQPSQSLSLYDDEVSFLRDALAESYPAPGAPVGAGGVEWREYGQQSIVEFVPPPDLRQRFEVLPQTYLAERKVMAKIKLATSTSRGKALLADALADETGSSWPEAHYLGPLHPVIDWAADRAMAALGRNQVFAVRGDVEDPTVLLLGTLTNHRGHVVASAYLSAQFPNPDNPGFCVITAHDSAADMADAVGFTGTASNPGPVTAEELQPLIAYAVGSAYSEMSAVFAAAGESVKLRVKEWSRRVADWTTEANALIQRAELKQRRVSIEEEQAMAAQMAPERQLVRPLLVVVPLDRPIAGPAEG